MRQRNKWRPEASTNRFAAGPDTTMGWKPGQGDLEHRALMVPHGAQGAEHAVFPPGAHHKPAALGVGRRG